MGDCSGPISPGSLLDVGRAAQDVEPLQDHPDGAQLAVHPLQSALQRHLGDQTHRLTHSRCVSPFSLKLKMKPMSEGLSPATPPQDRGFRLVIECFVPPLGPHGTILQYFYEQGLLRCTQSWYFGRNWGKEQWYSRYFLRPIWWHWKTFHHKPGLILHYTRVPQHDVWKTLPCIVCADLDKINKHRKQS